MQAAMETKGRCASPRSKIFGGAGSLAFLGILGLVTVIASPIRAEGLQVTSYTTDDGPASTNVLDLAQDALGRLWILGGLGITIYDGRSFTP